jgi:hypothetical protein
MAAPSAALLAEEVDFDEWDSCDVSSVKTPAVRAVPGARTVAVRLLNS